MKRQTKPYKEHAGSRYMCVTMGVIEALQQAYFAGRDLGAVVPGMDADRAALVVAETLEADRVWNLPPARLFSDEVDLSPMTDFKRAALAELLFGVSDVVRDKEDHEKAREWWALAMASLQECVESPTASPLLWYEDIFLELAYGARGNKFEPGDIHEAMSWLKRGLAYNLRYNEGGDAMNTLRDLAEMHIAAGELDTGLSMLTALLQNDPADIWTYNTMAISFDNYGLTDLGTAATQRGLALIDAKGDEEKLRDQLEGCLEQMRTAETHGREADVTPAVLADLRAALTLDFDAGQPRPIADLCHDLVPDLGTLPVKRPLTLADLPLPAPPAQLRRRLGGHQQPPQPPAKKPGRNDPCWCGSGKKYKHCHWPKER